MIVILASFLSTSAWVERAFDLPKNCCSFGDILKVKRCEKWGLKQSLTGKRDFTQCPFVRAKTRVTSQVMDSFIVKYELYVFIYVYSLNMYSCIRVH